jgi:hypothetical protein
VKGLDQLNDHTFVLRSDADAEARAVAHAVEVMEAFRTEILFSPLHWNKRREVDVIAVKLIRHLLRGYSLRKEAP